MLQDLLSDQNKQSVEHELEIQGLLQSMNTREQASQVSAAVKPDKGPVILMSADRKCGAGDPGSLSTVSLASFLQCMNYSCSSARMKGLEHCIWKVAYTMHVSIIFTFLIF